MSGRFNEFRHAVESTFAAAMPDLRECSAQLGRFDLEELQRNSIRAPALRVAILRAELEARADDSSTATLSCAAFAVADGKTRDDLAWAIAEAAAALLRRNQRFGLASLGAPTAIRVGPVLGAQFGQRGVSIVATEWKQPLHGIGEGLFDNEALNSLSLDINGEPVVYEEAP